jgi:DNA-binding MarR family transcriptional regulator
MSAASRARNEALDALGQAFKRTMAAQRRMRGRETHRPGELSFAQYSLLFGLCDGVARSARDLALAADVSPATVTEMLDALAASGLVERIRSDEDKRIVLTSLTERGRSLVDERRARYEPLWRAALGDFSEDELLAAARVLGRLREMFDGLADAEGGASREGDRAVEVRRPLPRAAHAKANVR